MERNLSTDEEALGVVVLSATIQSSESHKHMVSLTFFFLVFDTAKWIESGYDYMN